MNADFIDPFLNHNYPVSNEDFGFRNVIFTGALENPSLKPVENIVLSHKERFKLLSDLLQFLHKYEDKYPEPFLLREILNNNYKNPLIMRIAYFQERPGEIDYNNIKNDSILKQLMGYLKEKKSMLNDLKEIEYKYNKTNYDFIVQLVNIIIDIKDYILGGHATDISNKYNQYMDYIKRIA